MMSDAMKICPKCRSVASYNSYFGAYLCDKCGWRENTTDKIDLISRQAAVDEAKRLMRPDDDGTSINDTVRNMIRILQALPSTQRHTNRDLIEREAVRDVIYSNQEPLNEYQLNKIPAVEANADLVRCKDCKYWQPQEEWVTEVPICTRTERDHDYLMLIDGDGFCSYAERRTDD